MLRDHPVMEFRPWFAWHAVPVTDGSTAWLCWVERAIFWNGTCAFWAYRLPQEQVLHEHVGTVEQQGR